MRCVIQCANSKQEGAGTFITADGRRVAFVANPALAPVVSGVLHVHPDDRSDPADLDSYTWRDLVTQENRTPVRNRWGLLPAGRLYKPAPYAKLADWIGGDRLFILSAGWGLVRSDFLLPAYDITFNSSAEHYKRRRTTRGFLDFNALDGVLADDTAFLGGKDYLPLFLALTDRASGNRTVFYNAAEPPVATGCRLQAYRTARRTNWHYECATAMARGTVSPLFGN